MQKKFIFAKTVKILFLILFVWFSYKSASDYVNGKIVYDVINELDTNLVFPSVTLCPKQKGQSAFMNIEELGRDYPSKDPNVPVDGFSVYFAIGQQYPEISFDIVKNYSFKLNDLKIESTPFDTGPIEVDLIHAREARLMPVPVDVNCPD